METTITKYLQATEPVYVAAKTATVDISQYISAQGWCIFLFARSWVAENNGQSMYMISGIDNTTGYSLDQMSKGNYGPAMSFGSNKITITFYNDDGGYYCILPILVNT